MSNNHLLLRNLYFSASGKYLKFKNRFDKAIHSGRFYKLNKRKQSSLVGRLKRLFERLKSLQTQLRLAGAGAALAMTLAVSNPVQAQSSLGPFERNDALNPFPPPVNIDRPRPAVVDIDNDGDLDVFVGSVNGDIKFFRNDSPPDSVTRFAELTGTDNPLNGINKGSEAALAFADVDGDGDFDMLLGVYGAETFFLRNTGSQTNPVFTEQTGESNPFDGIVGTGNLYGSGQAIPVFVDLDGDTDLDLIIGSSYVNADGTPLPSTKYYENNAGNFDMLPDPAIAAAVEFYSNVALTFADIDNDGDLDAFAGIVGSGANYIRCFKQEVEGVFVLTYGAWNPDLRTGNPFAGFGFNKYASPSPVAADFDGDGDIDFLVGTRNNYYFNDETSNLRYFENTDGQFTLEDRTELNISPFGGVDVGNEATPVFTDLDNDGDLDAVMGEKYNGKLSVFINKDGKFYADPNHQLVNILDPLSNTYDIVPVFVDIDDDGDQDLFVCQDYGFGINFFRNDGGDFVLETSPLADAQYLRNTSLAFIDVDNDGDLDALIGNYTYGPLPVVYYQNNGTASNPNFAETTAPSPFDDLGFEQDANVYAVDLDHDGDTDLVVSETYYNGWYGDDDATRTWFFENNGDGSFDNPSEPIIIENTPDSFTSFADTDGDGDLDALIGNGSSFYDSQDGKVFFFENTNPPPVTNINITSLEVVGNIPIIIDPTLTIDDSDNDDIVQANVRISDFVPGAEMLDYTPLEGITGVFDDELGVLTLTGRADIPTYEGLLRTVTFNFVGEVPGGRRSGPASVLDLSQNITFAVLDTDFTLTTVSEVSLNIVPGNQTEINVFNAMSPNPDDSANPFFKIQYIESVSPENKVTIYNRWGDVVYEVRDYNNQLSDKRFEGVSNKGKELPTGTYYYKIEITGKTFTGYLSLKR